MLASSAVMCLCSVLCSVPVVLALLCSVPGQVAAVLRRAVPLPSPAPGPVGRLGLARSICGGLDGRGRRPLGPPPLRSRRDAFPARLSLASAVLSPRVVLCVCVCICVYVCEAVVLGWVMSVWG